MEESTVIYDLGDTEYENKKKHPYVIIDDEKKYLHVSYIYGSDFENACIRKVVNTRALFIHHPEFIIRRVVKDPNTGVKTIFFVRDERNLKENLECVKIEDWYFDEKLNRLNKHHHVIIDNERIFLNTYPDIKGYGFDHYDSLITDPRYQVINVEFVSEDGENFRKLYFRRRH